MGEAYAEAMGNAIKDILCKMIVWVSGQMLGPGAEVKWGCDCHQ